MATRAKGASDKEAQKDEGTGENKKKKKGKFAGCGVGIYEKGDLACKWFLGTIMNTQEFVQGKKRSRNGVYIYLSVNPEEREGGREKERQRKKSSYGEVGK